VIPAIPIAAALLAVLDDNDAPPDFDELFQRAVAFRNPSIFWDRISVNDTSAALDVLIPYLLDAYREKEPLVQTKEFDAVLNVIDINGTITEDVLLRLIHHLEAELATAKDLFDLKYKITAMKFDVYVGWLFYNRRNQVFLEESILNFTPDKGSLDVKVPTWGPAFAGMQDGTQAGHVISWDDTHVLLAEGTTPTSIKHAVIERREDVEFKRGQR
jgi:hypothetical protein